MKKFIRCQKHCSNANAAQMIFLQNVSRFYTSLKQWHTLLGMICDTSDTTHNKYIKICHYNSYTYVFTIKEFSLSG